jgi:4-azaleucine resistance transporter AzlC
VAKDDVSTSGRERVEDGGGQGAAARALPRLDAFRAGVRAGTPYSVAVLLVGISFGVLAEPVLGATATLAMSAFVFAGSAQFASTAVLAAGGAALPAIVAGILLNARYVPMGIALAPSLRGGWLSRAAYGEAMVDASWALANRGGGRFDPDFLVGATLPAYPAWVIGTAAGIYAGEVIGDPAALGLDALFPAFFLALLVNEVKAGRAYGVAAAGALVAVVLTPVAPPGVPVIAASLAALWGLRSRRLADGRLAEAQQGQEWLEAEEGP